MHAVVPILLLTMYTEAPWGDIIASGCNRMTNLRDLSLHLSLSNEDKTASPCERRHILFCNHILENLDVHLLRRLSLHGFKAGSTLFDMLHRCSSLRHLELLQVRLAKVDLWGRMLDAMRRIITLEALRLDAIQVERSASLPSSTFPMNSRPFQVSFGSGRERVHHHVWESSAFPSPRQWPLWYIEELCIPEKFIVHTSWSIDDCVRWLEDFNGVGFEEPRTCTCCPMYRFDELMLRRDHNLYMYNPVV
jgi:hypothetical protein